MRIRICERKFPDSGHKPEGKEVFLFLSPEIPSAIPHKAKISGDFNSEDGK